MIPNWLKTTKQLIKSYIAAGAAFGDAVSYLYMGKCIGFEGRLRKWEKLEKAIASRGYQPHSLDDFVGYGGYGIDLPELQKATGKPILHAVIYRERYDKVNFSSGLLDQLVSADGPNVISGTWHRPTTKPVDNED